MHFTKMQGIGNDYIYVNMMEETVTNPSELAKTMSRRHYGVGSDGLVLIDSSPLADFSMRIFNSDGSESEMCGNAARCIGKYVYEKGLTRNNPVSLMTGSGLKELWLNLDGDKVVSVRTDMGTPELDPARIPVKLPGDIVLGQILDIGGIRYAIHCVSMGNPHCVVFVRDADAVNLSLIGPLFEENTIFPNRVNTEFVQIIDRKTLRMRVWERGAGETMACGTGACASVVASVLTGRADRNVTVKLNGGDLHVEWSADDNHVYQEGPAEFTFEGDWNQ